MPGFYTTGCQQPGGQALVIMNAPEHDSNTLYWFKAARFARRAHSSQPPEAREVEHCG